jgi:nitrite reductase/ring-hydroxylating ferredoxin subunit
VGRHLLISVKELEKKGRYAAWIGQEEVLAIMTSGGVRVYSGMCPHQGGPLAEGKLTGDQLRCPWHGCLFDLKGGDCKDIGACHDVSGMKLKAIAFTVGPDANVYVELN